jgi:hypothetical protein
VPSSHTKSDLRNERSGKVREDYWAQRLLPAATQTPLQISGKWVILTEFDALAIACSVYACVASIAEKSLEQYEVVWKMLFG